MKIFYGFRSLASASIQNWPQDRIKHYLIRKNVNYIMSVDPRVWPLEDYANKDNNTVYITKKIYLEIKNCSEEQVQIIKNNNGLYCDDSNGGEFDFLGYDVADGSLTSALSNCGRDLSHDKIHVVNDNHLFDLLDEAVEFKHYSDKTIKNHAPFFIYALYRAK